VCHSVSPIVLFLFLFPPHSLLPLVCFFPSSHSKKANTFCSRLFSVAFLFFQLASYWSLPRRRLASKNPFFYFFRPSLTRATLVPSASESLSSNLLNRASLQSGQSRPRPVPWERNIWVQATKPKTKPKQQRVIHGRQI
jgi:hypothetical protein